MIKMADMTNTDAKELINDISNLMSSKYNIDNDSIDEFWGTMQIGYNAMNIV